MPATRCWPVQGGGGLIVVVVFEAATGLEGGKGELFVH
jgi:hypothetical protein